MTFAGRWLRGWSVVSAVGVGVSFLIWEPAVIALLWLCAMFCTALLLVLLTTSPGASRLAADTTWAWIATRAGLAGAAFVAVSAVGVISVVLALTLVLAAVLTAPPVASRVGRLVRHEKAEDLSALGPRVVVPREPECRLPVVLPVVAVRQLSTQELCREWRRSFTALQLATGPEQQLHVVGVRQLYLDEMERRCPSALQAWLASGARAASGPERYLLQDPGEPGSLTA